MRKIILLPELMLTFLLLPSCLPALDMQKYLTDTRELVKQKKYEEALTRTVWFHNHSLEYNKAMVGVRLSFALGDWKSLADVYPPAMTALIETRDNKTKKIIVNGGSAELFQDVAALNRTVNENDKTVKLFETIMQTYPDMAKQDWVFVKDILFTAKRYDIIGTYIGNPLREFATIEEQYKLFSNLSAGGKAKSAQLKAYYENSFVEKSLQLIEFSIASNDKTSAKEIKEKAMKIVGDYRLQLVDVL